MRKDTRRAPLHPTRPGSLPPRVAGKIHFRAPAIDDDEVLCAASCGAAVDVAQSTSDPLAVTCVHCKQTDDYLDRPLPYRVGP